MYAAKKQILEAQKYLIFTISAVLCVSWCIQIAVKSLMLFFTLRPGELFEPLKFRISLES